MKMHCNLVTLNLVSRQSIQSCLDEVCEVVLLLEDGNLPCNDHATMIRSVESYAESNIPR